MARIMLYVRKNDQTKRWAINISRVPVAGDYVRVPNGFANVQTVVFVVGDRDVEADVLAVFEDRLNEDAGFAGADEQDFFRD